jgi:hypothetical protein
VESALAPLIRLIEYPNDLSECRSIELAGKQLLFIHSNGLSDRRFVIVLGYYVGQKEDFVTKYIIEPADEDSKTRIKELLNTSLAAEYREAEVLFL